MKGKSIAKTQTPDRLINRLQDSIELALNPLLQNVLAVGNLVQGVSLAIGSNTINHGLGQALTGWMITRLNGGASIYDTQSTNPQPAQTLILVSDAAVVVDVYCF